MNCCIEVPADCGAGISTNTTPSPAAAAAEKGIALHPDTID
jgi:hypothetical protein